MKYSDDLDTEKNDFTETLVERFTENYEETTEGWLSLSIRLFRDGCKGGLTFLILMFAINAQMFIMGDIQNSELIISSISTAYTYMIIMAYGIAGFNSSLLVVVGRCHATNDYKRMRRFLKLGTGWTNVFSLALVLWALMVHFILGATSNTQETELLSYTRIAIWGMLPSWFMFINADNLRNFYLGVGSYNPPLIIETIGTAVGIFGCWLFTCYFN